MKRWIAVFLSFMLIGTACFALAKEDSDAIIEQGNEALEKEDYATVFELFSKAAELGNFLREDVTKCCFFENGWYQKVTRALAGWKNQSEITLSLR